MYNNILFPGTSDIVLCHTEVVRFQILETSFLIGLWASKVDCEKEPQSLVFYLGVLLVETSMANPITG